MRCAAATSPVFDVRLRAVVEARRRALAQQFGWTRFEITLAVDPPAGSVRLQGLVLLPQMAGTLARELAEHLPPGWSIDSRLHHLESACWHVLPPGVTSLRRGAPESGGAGELVTELRHGDGPVAPLATHAGAILVRTVDGALGWTTRGLGAVVAPPRPRHGRPDVARLARAARAYLDVPYRLGGATRRGIDCSGLVQRALRESTGVVVPRHSTDQVRDGGAAVRPLGEPGDVVCIWAGPRQAPHVGLVLRGRRPADRTVVHASATARRVVEEPLDRFLAQASRVAHVSHAQAVEQASCLPRL